MLEKFFKTIKENNFLRNAFSIFYLQTIAAIIGFISTFLLLKNIGVSGIGIIAILSTYVNFYIGIFSFQSYSAIIKFGQEAIEQKNLLLLKSYIKKAFVQDLITTIITLVVAYFCINITSEYFEISSKAKEYLYLYLTLIPFSIFRSVSAILRLNNDFKTGPYIAIAISIIRLATIIFGTYMNFRLSYFIILELLLGILGYLFHIVAGVKCLKDMNCSDFYKVKLFKNKRFTNFNINNNLVSTLDLPTGQLTNFIINKLLGIEVFGTFNVISKFGSIFNQIISALTQSLFPELSRLVAKKQIDAALLIIKKTFFVTFFSGLFIAFIFFISYEFWLYNFIPATVYNGYSLSIYVVYVSSVGAVAGVHLLFISLNLVKYNIPIVIFCNTIYILVLYILSGWFGLIGVILALLFQAFLIASIKYIITIKKVKEIKLLTE
jgi:O-antigen/teichoic acid export membrane protein